MSALNPKLSKSAAFLERPVARRKMGIVIAFALSAVVLVLSALGLANMWAAVFADVGVSVLAILNAMRALRFRD